MSHAGYEQNVLSGSTGLIRENITRRKCKGDIPRFAWDHYSGRFGNRGIEGMIQSAKYARENNLPYFGICLGMQIAVIEFARNVLGLKDAHSGEFDEQCTDKVIDFMPGAK